MRYSLDKGIFCRNEVKQNSGRLNLYISEQAFTGFLLLSYFFILIS